MLILMLLGISAAAEINETDNKISNSNINQKTTDTPEISYTPVKLGQNTSKNIIKNTKTSENTKTANQTSLKTKYFYVNPYLNINKANGSKNKPYTNIQSAVNKAAYSYNNIIYLSAGNHILSTPIQITKTITIIGEGSTKTNITCKNNQGFRLNKNSNLTLKNLKMQNAYYSQGGAILLPENTQLTIDKCTFKNNKANNGAVIFGSGKNIKANITNSVFEYNTNHRFGALHLGGYNSVYNIEKCTFNNNKLTDTNYSHSTGGAAIYASAYALVNVKQSIFKKNSGIWGNAILNGNHASLKITYSNFTNNIAKQNTQGINKTKGGAIAVGSGNVEIGHCFFANNRADVGGAITINSGETTLIYSCTFQKNVAYIQGGAINNFGTLIVKDSIFIKNNGTRRGGAILDIGNSEITVDNCTFKDNRVMTTQIPGAVSRVPHGGAISISGACHEFTIKNSLFNHNNAYYGGAIYSELDILWVTLTGNTFINNTACYGGAVIISGETTLDVDENIFKGNRALRKGGALLINGSVQGKFSKTQFISNTATISGDGDGGAIYVMCYSKLYFNTCKFEANTANMRGGVIGLASSAHIDIMRSNITNNKANKGSVIYLDNSKTYKTTKCKIIIETSTLLSNKGNYVLYSVKPYNEKYNNIHVVTSWWGSNVLPKNPTYNFVIKNNYILSLNLDDIVINTNWMKNTVYYTLNRTKNTDKNLIISIYNIKEGNTLRYTDAFLSERKFTIKENNNKALTKNLYVYYNLNMNLNKIEITLDNQKIILNIVK